MKNQIDFVKIKFHPNENIKWNCMQFELNSNSTIGLRFNWIERKWNENWWKIYWKSSCEDGVGEEMWPCYPTKWIWILNFYWIFQQQQHSKFNISNNLGLKITKSPL